MTHDDEEFPEVLRKAAREYNDPPTLSAADLDAIWSGVEREAFVVAPPMSAARNRAAGRWVSVRTLLPLAAVLLLGVAIGRFTVRTAPVASVGAVAANADSLAIPEAYHATASLYLGQTAALLATLPTEVRAGRADDRFMGRAHDLLLTTRLLLDSPAAADPRVRTLLDDLELVLAQIVRLQSDQSRTELDLIRQALEQRDVLPRLRNAVADISADD